MNIVGALLFVAGAVSALLCYQGWAPPALQNLGMSAPGWLGVSVLGAIIIYFNRRAGD